MRCTEKQLQKLSVETVSGIKLGKVRDVVFETDGQMIVSYVVTRHLWSAQGYHISREQIVRFTKDCMIVDDAVCNDRAAAQITEKPVPQPRAAMRTE